MPSTPVKLSSAESSPWQDTEPVFIQSSPQRRGRGPVPRVLRRQSNVFRSLRTQESPTVAYLTNKSRRQLGQVISKTPQTKGNYYVERPSKPDYNLSNKISKPLLTTIVPVIKPLDLTSSLDLTGSISPASSPSQTNKIQGISEISYFI